jgi:protein ImuB
MPLQAVLRAEPQLLGSALAVTSGSGDRAQVLQATQAARKSGVRAGLSAAQARAVCAGLLLREATAALRTAAGDALYDVASAFSPCIELHDDHALIEVGDLGQLFPDEATLCTALAGHAEKVGLRIHVALADQKATAHVLSRCRPGATCVPTGGERAALAPLPLSALGLPPAQAALVARFGLRTIGEFAALPRRQLASRLGTEGVALHRLSCGEEQAPLAPTPPPLSIRESVEFDDPIDNLEPLAFVLRGLLDRAVSRLAALCQSCGDYTLHMRLYPSGTDERRISVAAPTREVAPLLELARILLAAHPPAAPVQELAVQVIPTRPRAVQMSLFAPAGPRPEQLAVTLARLQALCGEGRVGTPVVVDTHLPGQAAVAPFVEPPPAAPLPASPLPGPRPDDDHPTEDAPPHLLATHVLRPPPPATVHHSGPQIEFLHTELVAGPVHRSGGPYRLRDGGGARVLRDYYDIELREGGVYRLFHDLHADRWYLDARYD